MIDIEDMQNEFNESQFAVIVSLQKKVSKLEEENKQLQKLLEGTTPVFNTALEIGISNQRIIAETQLALLKNSAINRELTLEEARKLQIYVDVLEKITKDKQDEVHAEVTEAELLQLVNNESR